MCLSIADNMYLQGHCTCDIPLYDMISKHRCAFDFYTTTVLDKFCPPHEIHKINHSQTF